MRADANTNQRIRELIAKVQTEQEAKRFSALVEELNRLLDDNQPAPTPPPIRRA
jgi:hypothetical protein